MTFHVAFRGTLTYADAASAAAALDAMLGKRKDNHLLAEIVRVRGKSIVAKYANFVSSYDDVESAQFALQEAADAAIGGQILYDGEGGEKTKMAPRATRIGRTPRKREYVDPVTIKGSLDFDSPKAAAKAQGVLARADVMTEARASKLIIRTEGKAALGVIEKMGDAIRDVMIGARAGAVTLKHRVWRTVYRAPLSPLGRSAGARRYARVDGKLHFKNRDLAAAAFARGADLVAPPKRLGRIQLVFDVQGTITKVDYARLLEQLRTFLREAGGESANGSAWIDVASGWGNEHVEVRNVPPSAR